MIKKTEGEGNHLVKVSGLCGEVAVFIQSASLLLAVEVILFLLPLAVVIWLDHMFFSLDLDHMFFCSCSYEILLHTSVIDAFLLCISFSHIPYTFQVAQSPWESSMPFTLAIGNWQCMLLKQGLLFFFLLWEWPKYLAGHIGEPARKLSQLLFRVFSLTITYPK